MPPFKPFPWPLLDALVLDMLQLGPNAHRGSICVWHGLALPGTLAFSHRLDQRKGRLSDVVGQVLCDHQDRWDRRVSR